MVVIWGMFFTRNTEKKSINYISKQNNKKLKKHVFVKAISV